MTRRATTSVRSRNDGENFHLLWTARRALRLPDERCDNLSIAVPNKKRRVAPAFLFVSAAYF